MVGKRCQQNEETGLVGERQWDNERAHSFSVFVFLRGKLEDSVRAAAGGAKHAPFSPAGALLLLICLLLSAPSEGDAATARSPIYYAHTPTHTPTLTLRDGMGAVPSCPSRLPSEALSPSPGV